MVAQALRGDLGGGDRLALGTQARLNLGLLRGAGAQLGSHRLAGGAVGVELPLQLAGARGDRFPGGVQRHGEPFGERREGGVGSVLGAQAAQALQTLGMFAREPLGSAALGGELALQLRAAHRQRPLLGGGAALLDQPDGVALTLERVGVSARGLAQLAVGLFAREIGGRRALLRLLGRAARGMLGGGGGLGCEDQLLALVAAGEHPLGAALGDLAHLAQGSKPHAPAGRDGDAREAVGEILQTLQHPRVGEQPPREREHRRGPFHQLDQGTRAGSGGRGRTDRRGIRRAPVGRSR